MILPDSKDNLDFGEKVNVPKPKDMKGLEESEGKLDSQTDEDKLMKSVLENDKSDIEDGQVLTDSINQGLGNFTPDMMFDQLVKDYKQAEKIMGESLIRALSGYDPSFIEKNINIPEFKRELDKKLKEKFDSMRKKKLIDKDGMILEKGYTLSSLVMYAQELDDLNKGGFIGERPNKKEDIHGEKNTIKDYKTHNRYKDIDIKKTVKNAVRRGHDRIIKEDLKVFTRHHKASTQIVYAIDASGSMKGDKIGVSKKAGIALAYKAIERKDKVGIIVFGEDVKERLAPTLDFMQILKTLSRVKAYSETDLARSISESTKLFLDNKNSKHLMLITDAMPTVGLDPEKEVLAEVAIAKSMDITVSIVGINLDNKGESLAKKICDIGEGQFHIVRDLKNMDKIILEDYYKFY